MFFIYLETAGDIITTKATLSKKRKEDADIFSNNNEVDYEDYFNVSSAKLKNRRMLKKNIVSSTIAGKRQKATGR